MTMVLWAIVDELVRLTWTVDKGVASLDRRPAGVIPSDTSSGNHMIKLPLRSMRVVGIRRLARGEAQAMDQEMREAGGLTIVAIACGLAAWRARSWR